MKILNKIGGGLAVALLMAGAMSSTTNANTLSNDEITISEVSNLDDVLKIKEWTFVSSDYVYKESTEESIQ